jgi:hypothetical protein
MHDYSINISERKNIYFILAGISIGIMYIIRNTVCFIPWYIESPSPFLLFGIFSFLFDKILWKIQPFKYFIKTPNMNGEYNGILKSSYDNFNNEYKVTVIVKQSWTNILITLKTDTSESNSQSASIIFMNEKICLFYSYLNKPEIDSVDSMHIHFGTCTHVYNEKENTFNAEYYTSRDRKTFGIINLNKK